MILLPNARIDPRTMMIELTNAFTAFIAMLSPNLNSTITNIAKGVVVAFSHKQFVLLKCTSLKSWIIADSEHKISVCY